MSILLSFFASSSSRALWIPPLLINHIQTDSLSKQNTGELLLIDNRFEWISIVWILHIYYSVTCQTLIGRFIFFFSVLNSQKNIFFLLVRLISLTYCLPSSPTPEPLYKTILTRIFTYVRV
jgi:hypothetical protein